jgi:hypothetical protein
MMMAGKRKRIYAPQNDYDRDAPPPKKKKTGPLTNQRQVNTTLSHPHVNEGASTSQTNVNHNDYQSLTRQHLNPRPSTSTQELPHIVNRTRNANRNLRVNEGASTSQTNVNHNDYQGVTRQHLNPGPSTSTQELPHIINRTRNANRDLRQGTIRPFLNQTHNVQRRPFPMVPPPVPRRQQQPVYHAKPYKVIEYRTRYIKKYAAEELIYQVKFAREWRHRTLGELQTNFYDMFADIINALKRRYDLDSKARLFLQHPDLKYSAPVFIALRPLRDLTVEAIMQILERVINSNLNVKLTSKFRIDIGIMQHPMVMVS